MDLDLEHPGVLGEIPLQAAIMRIRSPLRDIEAASVDRHRTVTVRPPPPPFTRGPVACRPTASRPRQGRPPPGGGNPARSDQMRDEGSAQVIRLGYRGTPSPDGFGLAETG